MRHGISLFVGFLRGGIPCSARNGGFRRLFQQTANRDLADMWRLLSAFTGETHCYARHRREFINCPASAFEGSVPLATAQERPDNLPFALVTTYTIAAMETHGKEALPPAFVNVVVKSGLHSSPPACCAEVTRERAEVS